MTIRSLAGAGAAIAVVAALAVPKLISHRSQPAAAPAPATAVALPVEVVEMVPRRLAERLATTGSVVANEQVDLVAEIAGLVREVHFREGMPVDRGALLIKIDDTELQAQRDRIRFQLRLAETRERRQSELREQGVVSEQDYDIASNELNVLRAELRLIEARLEKTEIRAPFGGVIGLRRVSVGRLLSPQTSIATLQDLDPVKIDFTLPEKYAGRVAPGLRVEVRVKGVDRAIVAEVYAVEPQINAETRSLVLRARAPNPDGAMLPGAFADVTLDASQVLDALVVPALAVIPELGGRKVFVVDRGLAQPRAIETGIRTETEVQVTSGLAPGDRVIVSAVQRLRPGLAVTPTTAGAGQGADR